MKDNKLVIIKDDGTEVECDVFMTCRDDEAEKEYIIYTDNTEDEDGNVTVYASILKSKGPISSLLPIETDEEWAQIKSIIKEYQQ